MPDTDQDTSRPLLGRVVVVTGGFGVLGRAVGTVLMEHGARVALVDRAAVPAASEPGEGLLHLGEVDLGSSEAARSSFAQIAQRWKRIDALVNVAGGFAWETLSEGSLETWDRMYAMNLRTAVAASQAVLPHLKERGAGRIVNVGALAAIKAGTGRRTQGQRNHRQRRVAEHHRHAQQSR